MLIKENNKRCVFGWMNEQVGREIERHRDRKIDVLGI